jgi:hypothetical protein
MHVPNHHRRVMIPNITSTGNSNRSSTLCRRLCRALHVLEQCQPHGLITTRAMVEVQPLIDNPTRTRKASLFQLHQMPNRKCLPKRLQVASLPGLYCITQAVCTAVSDKYTLCMLLLLLLQLLVAALCCCIYEAGGQGSSHMRPRPSMCVTSRWGQEQACQSSWAAACAAGQPCTGAHSSGSGGGVSSSLGNIR